MNQLLSWLTGGDLRSDGLSNETAAFVLDHPPVFRDLLAGLVEPDKLIRARAADALEKVARRRPDLLVPHLPHLIKRAAADDQPLVRMHLAMIFGHLILEEQALPALFQALSDLLRDPFPMVQSWTISSLCLIGRRYPAWAAEILPLLLPLQNSPSAAIRARVRQGLPLLTEPDSPFPPGWIKSAHLQAK